MSEATLIREIVHRVGADKGLATMLVQSAQLRFCDPPDKNPALAETLEKIEGKLEDIGRFLRILSQSIPEEPLSPMDVWEVVDAAMMRVRLPDSIEVIRKRGFTVPAFLATSRVIEVTRNVIQNAIDSMPEGGKVILDAHTSPDGRQIIFSVQDTGWGIQPEAHEQLFRQFFPRTATKEGIGLYWSHLYLGHLGGEIRIDTQIGSGTLVRVLLPIRSVDGVGDSEGNG